jgi:hypothetical protein
MLSNRLSTIKLAIFLEKNKSQRAPTRLHSLRLISNDLTYDKDNVKNPTRRNVGTFHGTSYRRRGYDKRHFDNSWTSMRGRRIEREVCQNKPRQNVRNFDTPHPYIAFAEVLTIA